MKQPRKRETRREAPKRSHPSLAISDKADEVLEQWKATYDVTKSKLAERMIVWLAPAPASLLDVVLRGRAVPPDVRHAYEASAIEFFRLSMSGPERVVTQPLRDSVIVTTPAEGQTRPETTPRTGRQGSTT